ncbi:MAG: metallophosphoesterase [Candidatus Eisenbacteria bacterium]|uniref:Metallophosphoesterase n=1 Tax=Eiseniibacteriota bacterium TaxID=2212470 RepID=A0A948W6M0_UNCEI|nr:metallophosphoesterase [Candidatus Eisenbacteria bacterium]MBU1949137.1 metallophosphoesterase [Candidatus Eisenbacteria bacterium]MBU2690791.1 metallophosphoesterase [Candidatus Eisenbacteria bacterium]
MSQNADRGFYPVTGPYWTPAGEGSVWASLILAFPLEKHGQELGSLPPQAVLELKRRGQTARFLPDEQPPSPVWPGVLAARFQVECKRWDSYRMLGKRWETAWMSLPRSCRADDPDRSPETPPEFLILSDLQLLPLIASTIPAAMDRHLKDPVDGVLFAGDMVTHPERREDWWGDSTGRSFFDLTSPVASPGLLATSLLIPCPGNHDISSAYGATAEERFDNVKPDDWNLRVYSHLFPLPRHSAAFQELRRNVAGPGIGPSDYYANRLGDVWIGSLFVTRAYVSGNHDACTGPAYESPGRFIFEPVTMGSPQYRWLEEQLRSPACRSARVRIVLMHHGIYAQGHSALPPFGYPPDYEEDLLVRDLVPLLKEGCVDLVVNGHNHIVNHRIVDGIHYVESSHTGVTYQPYKRLPDGEWSPEPWGHPSRLLMHEPDTGFFSILHTNGVGRLQTFRVDPGGRGAVSLVDETVLDFTF